MKNSKYMALYPLPPEQLITNKTTSLRCSDILHLHGQCVLYPCLQSVSM